MTPLIYSKILSELIPDFSDIEISELTKNIDIRFKYHLDVRSLDSIIIWFLLQMMVLVTYNLEITRF